MGELDHEGKGAKAMQMIKTVRLPFAVFASPFAALLETFLLGTQCPPCLRSESFSAVPQKDAVHGVSTNPATEPSLALLHAVSNFWGKICTLPFPKRRVQTFGLRKKLFCLFLITQRRFSGGKEGAQK
jgi:hypothetical protein